MKKILVVGATSAIANECSRLWALSRDAAFFLVGRDQAQLESIATDLRVRGALETHVIHLDMNNFDLHSKIVSEIWQRAQKIDLALFAHGYLGDQAKAEKDHFEVMNLVNTNFVSHVSFLTLIGERFKLQKSGTIAVISSVAGERGKQSNFIYGAAMAGKTVFTDGLRNRLYPFGVHVVTLKLGFVDSPMTAAFKKGALWVSSAKAAVLIDKAVKKSKDSVYVPGIWALIMLVIRSIPERVFKRLRM